jgi:hypothetical protein
MNLKLRADDNGGAIFTQNTTALTASKTNVGQLASRPARKSSWRTLETGANRKPAFWT